ncbi:MAG: hypothetical protein OXT65_09785 [Alphaproteobacteria bacterium]|nr:hypothetical protein [Alphaproteobacteria bacterium]
MKKNKDSNLKKATMLFVTHALPQESYNDFLFTDVSENQAKALLKSLFKRKVLENGSVTGAWEKSEKIYEKERTLVWDPNAPNPYDPYGGYGTYVDRGHTQPAYKSSKQSIIFASPSNGRETDVSYTPETKVLRISKLAIATTPLETAFTSEKNASQAFSSLAEVVRGPKQAKALQQAFNTVSNLYAHQEKDVPASTEKLTFDKNIQHAAHQLLKTALQDAGMPTILSPATINQGVSAVTKHKLKVF